MIADLKPYAAYKDSGLPWLGQVPAHWDSERAKWLFTKMDRPVRGDEEVVTCFRDGMVTLRKNRRLRGYTESTVFSGFQGIRKGDLVIHGMDAFAGAIGVSDSDGKGTPVYNVCQPKPGIDAHYYAYLIREMSRSQWILALAKGIRERSTDFRFEMFGNQRVPLPPLAEQAAIVRFLDWANGRLERAIRLKRKTIALLNEQKQAIIHRAVTRGLDPDAPLKDSGIPWLGETPAHWEVRKLKFEMSFRGGGTPSKGNPAFWNGSIPWVSPKDMKSDVIRDTEDHITERAVAESSTNLVPAGSLLMVVRSGILQRSIPVALCNREVALNQDMKALISKGRIDLEYFVLFVRGCEKRLLRVWTKQGATVESIEHQYLANTKVPIPPIGEQRLIVRQLAVEIEPQTNTISRLEREIALLREYRTRLVADVVTGKLDVREAAARLPDEAPLPDAADADEADLEPVDDAEDP